MQMKLTAALLKKPASLHKETQAQKLFWELPKRNRMPSAKHFWQTSFFRLLLRVSEMV